MSRKRKRHVSPGVTLGRDLRQAELSQTTYQQGGDLPFGNFNDGAAALGVVPHPSVKYANQELMPCRPREKFEP